MGYVLKCFGSNFTGGGLGGGRKGKRAITVGQGQFTSRKRRINHSFTIICSFLMNVLQFPLWSLSLNYPDQVMVDLLCLFKQGIDFVSIFIELYNPFMDLVTLISSGDCLDSKSVSCFDFLFPSIHAIALLLTINSIIHWIEEPFSKNLVWSVL